MMFFTVVVRGGGFMILPTAFFRGVKFRFFTKIKRLKEVDVELNFIFRKNSFNKFSSVN